MRFDTLDAVRAFACEEYETAVVLPKGPGLAGALHARSQPYAVRADLKAP
jgi:hypothetical protein